MAMQKLSIGVLKSFFMGMMAVNGVFRNSSYGFSFGSHEEEFKIVGVQFSDEWWCLMNHGVY